MKSIKQIIEDLNGSYYQAQSNLEIKYLENLPNGEVGLNRRIDIKAENGEEFYIIWYKNLLYIYYGKAIIPCHNIKLSSTWPNNSMLNIQSEYNGETNFILPIRDWDLEDE